MRVGVQLPEVEREVRWPEVVAIAKRAEAEGFESVWVGDHLLYRDEAGTERGPWEVWTQMAALAAATDRVRIGPLVACLGFHPPAVLAKMAASVDEVSAGRFVLGVGSGWNRTEFDAFGIPFDHKVSRFEDAMAIVAPLVRGEHASHAGRYWSADGAVLLPPPTRPIPIMAGVSGPRALGIALPHADAWNTWWDDYDNDPAKFPELNARITAAAEQAGRDPATLTRSACVLVSVGDGPRERPGDLHVPHERLPEHLAALEAAGADEAILVLDPITEASVSAVGKVLWPRLEVRIGKELRIDARAHVGGGTVPGAPPEWFDVVLDVDSYVFRGRIVSAWFQEDLDGMLRTLEQVAACDEPTGPLIIGGDRAAEVTIDAEGYDDDEVSMTVSVTASGDDPHPLLTFATWARRDSLGPR